MFYNLNELRRRVLELINQKESERDPNELLWIVMSVLDELMQW